MSLDERGFTLVEMLMAIVVSGLVAAAMFQLLSGQNRFYGEVSDRSYAEETLRASAELAASELRLTASGDVRAARSDSVAVRADVLRGHVCQVTATGNVYFYVTEGVSAGGLQSISPGLLDSRGTAYSNPFTRTYDYDDGFDATGTPSSTARTECETWGAPAGMDAARYRVKSWGGSLAPPDPGATLRVYRTLSYYFAPSDMGDGLALWRNDGELASPFDPQGAGFRYRVCTGGSCGWHTNVSTASEQRDIRRIELQARALGDGANRYDVALDLDYDLTLRNYIQN